MSLLSQTVLRGHLDESAFAELWSTSATSGEPVAHGHLSSCPQCRARYEAFTSWLERIQEDGRADADEAFTAERLAAQQAHVMRRLEALERPARVIAFPTFARPTTASQGHAQRWVATAAAAGLVIGLAAGQFLDIRDAFSGRQRLDAPEQTTARVSDAVRPVNPAVTPAARYENISEEALFFGDPVQRVSVGVLQSVDDITPRARDLERPR